MMHVCLFVTKNDHFLLGRHRQDQRGGDGLSHTGGHPHDVDVDDDDGYEGEGEDAHVKTIVLTLSPRWDGFFTLGGDV